MASRLPYPVPVARRDRLPAQTAVPLRRLTTVLFMRMASTGHAAAHLPSPAQADGLARTAIPSRISRQPLGHRNSQVAQPVHLNFDTTGIKLERIPVPRP